MSKKILYSIIIIGILVFILVLSKINNNNPSQKNTIQETPVNTPVSIQNNIESLSTSTDYENNGNIQQDFQSIDNDINSL